MSRAHQVVEGDSVTVDLLVMPEKYQIYHGPILDYFTASSDSLFWCGPNSPNPYSWLTTSIFCREPTNFLIQLHNAEGDTIGVFDFLDVAPATYRVVIDQDNRPEPGIYTLEFHHAGEVVDTFKIHVTKPR